LSASHAQTAEVHRWFTKVDVRNVCNVVVQNAHKQRPRKRPLVFKSFVFNIFDNRLEVWYNGYMGTVNPNLDSCQDFMGTTMKVGDFLARTINGEMLLSQITRIRLKKSKNYNIPAGCYVMGDPFIVCEIVDVIKGAPKSGYKPTIRPDNTVKVDENIVMLYKFSLSAKHET